MAEFEGTIRGSATINPMLAFGDGPEGAICSECKEYDQWDGVCRKRIPYGTTRRRHKRHEGGWAACKHFGAITVMA